MKRYRCPDPSHGETIETLKSNNDRIYECPRMHKYWRREEGGNVLLADLITGETFPTEDVDLADTTLGPEKARLNFMVDVPRLTGGMDFNALSLTPPQWKVISRIDGSSNLEEVRLLAGLSPPDLERTIYELVEAGLVEVKRRGGR
ncbi:MAG TPA: hypothetical protein VGK94_10170 [Candidatus Polarisedimenticolia bacterium]|jgi:hypothetical protein